MGLNFYDMADLVDKYHWDYWQELPDVLIRANDLLPDNAADFNCVLLGIT
jgi:hypothetical protein